MQADLSGVLRRGINDERSIAKYVAEDARVERFHVRNGGVAHLIDAAAEQVLVMENQAVVGEVDHVVPEIEPRLHEENQCEEKERKRRAESDRPGANEQQP